MAFSLGNFTIDEIIMGVAQDKETNHVLYTLDQLSGAQIEISSESTDVTDKRGNIVRTIYKTKQGTFTATNAFLHPQVLNAQSGTQMIKASADNVINMPKIATYTAGSSVILPNYTAGSLEVIGLYGSGGNSARLTENTQDTNPYFDGTTGAGTYKITSTTADGSTVKKLVLPPAPTQDNPNAPVNYVVTFLRDVTDGYQIVNDASTFGSTVSLTFSVAIVDPCSSQLRSAYLVIPSFQPSPETTVSLNADEQELDFTGILQTDYCGTNKILYYFYFPDEYAVTTAVSVSE